MYVRGRIISLTMIGEMELQPDDGPRSSLGIGPGSDNVVGPRREFTRRFAEGIGKLAENTPGDRRKTRCKNAGSCRIGGMRRRMGGQAWPGLLQGRPVVAKPLAKGQLAMAKVPCIVCSRLRPARRGNRHLWARLLAARRPQGRSVVGRCPQGATYRWRGRKGSACPWPGRKGRLPTTRP
ncbi:hypothetical protein B296_00006492 [Ensete ventricosum]|uniref:Uncharacterized protein n=1 Tax=Ensete ventricosum TaxID=4639 RepID=A0A426ZZF8_ENSVE|nr:hypothetical protein B296_00006492 [Ensete ventricosum]